MPTQTLITGGGGFIGSHLADELVDHGHVVRVLDNFDQQVHPGGCPEYLDERVEIIDADVRDRHAVDRAVDGVDRVYHLAAAVGVGQSMYQIGRYTSVNNVGTATLLEALINQPPDRLVVASSMSLYGEGAYVDRDGAAWMDVRRTSAQLADGQWEPVDGRGRALEARPTAEDKTPGLASVYALSKYDQEQMCLMVGRAYDVDTTALRFFNVYGPRQSLSNPYTGVLAIFGARYLNDHPPLVFEDGRQRRDFVHVADIARACRLAGSRPEAVGEVFNIASGQSHTVGEVADRMGRAMDRADVAPQITGEYRVGDVRHCFADISKAQRLLDYRPRVGLDDGLAELAQWMASHSADDRVDQAHQELSARGLTTRP